LDLYIYLKGDSLTNDEKIYCIASGKELERSNNGNSQSKEKRKDAILFRGLCELSYISKELKSLLSIEDKEEIEDIKNAIQVIEKMREDIKKINNEYTVNDKDSEKGELSGHHPAKKAICGPNDFIVPMDRSVHARLENNNISLAEGMILLLRLGVYAAINAAFIRKGGKDLTRRELVDIIMQEEMNIRKISQKSLKSKLLENHSPIFNAKKVANMLRSRGVNLDEFKRAN
jgi:hypothetical protein